MSRPGCVRGGVPCSIETLAAAAQAHVHDSSARKGAESEAHRIIASFVVVVVVVVVGGGWGLGVVVKVS